MMISQESITNVINDIFINEQELENELQNMQQAGECFQRQFSLLSQQVAYIFTKIETCKTSEEANNYFEILSKIQEQLARLLYVYHIGMPDRLLRFVRDFDNLEPIYRKHYFEKIASKEYSF